MKKIAVVTGGSSGIGFSILQELQRQNILAVSWDLQAPGDASPFLKTDILSESEIAYSYAQTVERFGVPNILVNNAGLQFLSPVEDFPLEKWNQILGVVLTGTFLSSKVMIPAMKEQKWGRIVNISSIHGKVASPYKAAYVAAKHGVLGLSKVMAQELGEFGITVNSICPGFVETPLLQKQILKQAELNQMNPEFVKSEIMLKPQVVKEFTSPEQVAALVHFLCSPSASTITGEAYNMAGGWGMGS